MLDRIDIKYFKLAVGRNLGKETDSDIAARCPVCGDSRSNPRSTRLHLYKKGDYTGVNCFNGDCSAENKTVFSFLRDFFPEHLSGYRREKFQDNLATLGADNSGDVFGGFSDSEAVANDDWEIAPLETQSPVISIDLKNYMTPIEKVSSALDYIKSRELKYTPEIYGNWFYGHQNLEIDGVFYRVQNSIIIPLYTDSSFSEMYGFYSRSISDKFFCTFMQDVNIGYKIWNYFNIDKSEPVYVFEGIFDALASGLDNVIALMGAKLPQERLQEIDPVFVLDNDRTGLLNSLEYADLGYPVFVQDKYSEKDMNELMKSLKKTNPDLNIPNFIKSNILKGIFARVKISSLL